MNDGLLNYQEAAQFLGLAPTSLYRWVSQRKIPFVKIGRATRFRRQDLQEYVEQHRVPAITQGRG